MARLNSRSVHFHAPPFDVFPAYEDPSGPGADNYIIDPEYPEESYF